MKKKNIVLITILVVFAFFLRANNLAGKTTFDWDQARDVGEMTTMIDEKDPRLLGPVVRGAGGFYIGPLYYYLAVPFFLIGGRDPAALTVFSILIDSFIIYGIYHLISKKKRSSEALLISLIWAVSWLNIQFSHTPWNVSLMQVWMLAIFASSAALSKKPNLKNKFLLLLIASFSIHVHTTLIPIAGIITLVHVKQLFQVKTKRDYLWLFFAILIPLAPLIVFDLRNNFINSRLFIRFIRTTSNNVVVASEYFKIIRNKIGYTISRFFYGRLDVIGGIIIYLSLLLYGLLNRSKHLIKLSILTLIAMPILLAGYRDKDFAEYYIHPMFIPLLILFSDMLYRLKVKISKDFLYRLGLFIIGSLLLTFNMQKYDPRDEPYSLKKKKEVVQIIKRYDNVVSLELDLPPGRKDGIEYLMNMEGISTDDDAKTIVIITEDIKVANLIDNADKLVDELAGSFRVTVFAVQ